jgi:hypothetical protein
MARARREAHRLHSGRKFTMNVIHRLAHELIHPVAVGGPLPTDEAQMVLDLGRMRRSKQYPIDPAWHGQVFDLRGR